MDKTLAIGAHNFSLFLVAVDAILFCRTKKSLLVVRVPVAKTGLMEKPSEQVLNL